MARGVRTGAVVLVVVALAAACGGDADADAGDEDPTVTRSESETGAPAILAPETGDVVGERFTVEIDEGPIDPTGETVPADYGGRFHLLIDQGCLDNAEGFPPPDDRHLVFEAGETSLDVELPPGAHELCLQFGNAFDVAFYATDVVTIRVE
jgi:hypothetical protein